MDTGLNSQQQQQQFPPSLEADLNQQATHAPSPPAPKPDSPRRLNAPIDIDTALRIQSQASYVQEPATRASPASPKPNSPGVGGGSSAGACNTSSVSPSSTSTLERKSPNQYGAKQQFNANANANARSSVGGGGGGGGGGGESNPTLGHQSATGNQLVVNQRVNQGDQQKPYRQPLDNIGGLDNHHYYYYDNYHHNNDHYYQHAGGANISVDYIDCLSNSDLISPAVGTSGSTPHAQTNTTTMRGIPLCRRHLGRFHRSHRIEPDPEATHSSDQKQREQQQGRATSSTSNESAAPVQNQPVARDANNHDSASLITSNSTNADDCSSSIVFDGPHQQQQQQQQAGAGGSVLYPIAISEAKKRTYFIGSVSQNPLLSHDELHRYFPNGRVSIFVCTWNQNRKRAPVNLNDLLLPDQLIYMPDIYAIGIQEAYSSQQDYLREWEIELQTTLGPNHVLLHSCSLGSLHLALFIRRDLIWFCSTPEESLYNSRSMPTNMIKTKGAVSLAFRFFGTSFMFTNCHFPAHENKLRDRIDEYQRIINSIDLPKNLKLLKPRYLSNDSTARFDCVFFMGDLNFRLEHRSFDETIQILDDIFQSREPSFEALTQNDELLKVMESQQAFHGFDECQIRFPPTYKFLAQTNKYDRQTKRVPSYTDRILFRSKRQRHIHCLIYDWLPQLLSSDHKPVYSLFDVLIRPGQERNMVGSLNAGQFQRPIYMEALKRRAEDSDGMRENGASGNLICSIS